MKILITGGLGLIGSHLAESLLDHGFKVCVVDNLSVGRKAHLSDHPNLTIEINTISDKNFVDCIFDEFKPTVVIHAAASFKNATDWEASILTNCIGGTNIIQAAKRIGVDKFVYFQTGLIYENLNRKDQIKESDSVWPTPSLYSITKYANGLFLELAEINHVCYRLSNIIGPRNLIGVVPSLYNKIINNQTALISRTKRDFIHVSDLTRVVVLDCCENILSGVYNFSTGNLASIEELYTCITGILGKNETNYKMVGKGVDDVSQIYLDSSKLRHAVELEQFTPLEITLKEAIAYYQKFGVSQSLTHLNL